MRAFRNFAESADAKLPTLGLSSGTLALIGGADFLRRGRQERAVSVARVAARRDGRPDAGQRAHPCRDDGGRRRVHALPRLWLPAEPDGVALIAWIGGITALMAALIAVPQNDIKRILAYSTLSQLGYMVMAVGWAGRRRPCSI